MKSMQLHNTILQIIRIHAVKYRNNLFSYKDLVKNTGIYADFLVFSSVDAI